MQRHPVFRRRAQRAMEEESRAVTPPWLLGEIPAPPGGGGLAQMKSPPRAQELGREAMRPTREKSELSWVISWAGAKSSS